MKARYQSKCPMCEDAIWPGDEIKSVWLGSVDHGRNRWIHSSHTRDRVSAGRWRVGETPLIEGVGAYRVYHLARFASSGHKICKTWCGKLAKAALTPEDQNRARSMTLCKVCERRSGLKPSAEPE